MSLRPTMATLETQILVALVIGAIPLVLLGLVELLLSPLQ